MNTFSTTIITYKHITTVYWIGDKHTISIDIPPFPTRLIYAWWHTGTRSIGILAGSTWIHYSLRLCATKVPPRSSHSGRKGCSATWLEAVQFLHLACLITYSFVKQSKSELCKWLQMLIMKPAGIMFDITDQPRCGFCDHPSSKWHPHRLVLHMSSLLSGTCGDLFPRFPSTS